MLGYALRSLRDRGAASAASFAALFLGAGIVMSFAAMLDTARGDAVDVATADALFLVATVVGSWSLVIVAFAVASTLTLAVRQRHAELALLRAIGATPAQVGRSIATEAVVLALVAWGIAMLIAVPGGRALLGVLEETGRAAPGTGYAFGWRAVTIGFVVTLLGATVAAVVTARRTTGRRAADAVLAASIGQQRLSAKRQVAGWSCITIGLGAGVVTATVFRDQGIDAMQTGGQAGIWVAAGLALLAPALLRPLTTVVGPLLRRGGGVGGYLAAHNLRERSHRMAGWLAPVVLFTSIATGGVYMQRIENTAAPVMATITAEEARTIETLNMVVIGIIVVFTAIVLVNTLVASTTYRRREFAIYRLVGLTPAEVLRMVGAEATVMATVGTLLGSVAAIVTVVPYSIARTGSVLPDQTLTLYLGIVGAGFALTAAASLVTARWAMRSPAVGASA